ncbi:uncharacterized protein BCR38DRAFT_410344 [Pseudomassariella vexata]|uniref:Uncharacterized protein n=1 Tax=Pseudomassariella vexata TaxID=1141098 RepID=A0A1Y2DW96_9PEZI|nr:uncharacterized protein BCR38DRAFT_410344 [Pseudomassariella vexata]ORY63416.1 hypothetical protein BCR38DRAFT_410344 [Pseudomassariella vexata]
MTVIIHPIGLYSMQCATSQTSEHGSACCLRVGYQVNPFLGANGENCDMQFWANYWYCVNTGKAGVVTETRTTMTIMTSTDQTVETIVLVDTSRSGDAAVLGIIPSPITNITIPKATASLDLISTAGASGTTALQVAMYLGFAYKATYRALN